VPTSCRSMTRIVDVAQRSRRSARASRCTGDRSGRGGSRPARWRRLDHCFLHVGCGTRAADRKSAVKPAAGVRRQPVGDVGAARRRPMRVADDPDPAFRRAPRNPAIVGAERSGHGSKTHSHEAIISQGFTTVSKPRSSACLFGGAVDMLRAFGGQPCLLRPRQEPIDLCP